MTGVNDLVEAAGVEPAPPQNANWLMARDFRRNSVGIRCLPGNSLCSGVLCAVSGYSLPSAGGGPSCLGRRMAATSAYLVDRVLPQVPVRRLVLTRPHFSRFWDRPVPLTNTFV